MPKRIWNGAQPEVELVLPEGSVVVKHGESVEVDADTARNLDEQESNWLTPGEKKPTAKTEEKS